MSTPSSETDHDRLPDWHDPFAEPRTIPGGWDFSGLTADVPGPAAAPTPPRPAARPARRRWLAGLFANWN